ncbi:hypothetical protein N9T42_04225 [SAR86 cluster bacterium]|jgi:hypothetical protein|nr:hypothetical protein [SAR86 cluster bacterium]
MKKKDKEIEINKNGEITQEVLEALSKKYNIKILPEDHPIYQGPPTIIIGPSSRKKKKKE